MLDAALVFGFCTKALRGIACVVNEVTHILDRVQKGDPKAAEELLPLVYEELRKLAAHKMANEAPGQTLQPTALVHEAWLRLLGDEPQRRNSRGHFFGAAAEAMRRILIDRAREKQARRHGLERLDVEAVELAAPQGAECVLEDVMKLANNRLE